MKKLLMILLGAMLVLSMAGSAVAADGIPHTINGESHVETAVTLGLSELFEIYSIDDFINNHTLIYNGVKITNPFIEQVNSRDIDFEDTVILYNNENDIIDENNIIDKIKIDTYEKYDFIKHHCPYNIARHNLAPKNLKGSNK